MSINKEDVLKIVRHFVKENKSSGSIPSLVITNEINETSMHVTDCEKVECLNEYFTSISTISEDPNLIPKTDAKLDQIIISEQELIEMLGTHNIYRVSGPDGISNKMMKCVAKTIAKPLTSLYNRLLKHNHFPNIYKYSHVIPL